MTERTNEAAFTDYEVWRSGPNPNARDVRVILRTYATRTCCGTTYDCHHLDDCPERGIAARAALPCDITEDGWCASHSTGEGPAYCTQPANQESGA